MKRLNIGLSTILVVLGVFLLSPTVRAVSPPPDGGYANFNTAEGQNALNSLTTGIWNVANGAYALPNNTDGSYNTAVGTAALLFNVGDQTTGEGLENTAVGVATLLFNDTGRANTAVGVLALENNNSGVNNTATGHSALAGNQAGFDNTADGVNALISNNNGNYNTATGVNALYGNTSGNNNTANGVNALAANNASYNTATGVNALEVNTNGSDNTAIGYLSLASNDTGSNNTALGEQTLFSNTGPSNNNTALGFTALYNNNGGNANTAVGVQALYNNVTGNFNTAVGFNAGLNTTGDNNLNIGNPGVAGESNTVRVGTGDGIHTRMFLAGVYGTLPGGSTQTVVVSNTGQIGTLASSERFKKDIAAMEKASEAILSLRPVTFHYKNDNKGTPQFGLIAEEVAKADPALVLLDKEGKPWTVRYEAVNAMLLNEFLKEHKKVQQQAREIQEQNETLSQLKKGMDNVVAQLREQESRIQKVSAQFELFKGATRTVVKRK